MENASKALIIAGAILISIVLVSVGVIVVNSLNTDDATDMLDQQQVQSFNAKFEASTGSNKTGTTVKQLITAIITNNTSNSDDTSKQVKVTYGSYSEVTSSTDLTAVRSAINSATRYNVAPTYSDNSGLIEVITITVAN